MSISNILKINKKLQIIAAFIVLNLLILYKLLPHSVDEEEF